MTVFNYIQIEPSASSGSTGSGSELTTNVLKSSTSLILKLGWEWSTTDTCGIGLHDSNLSLNSLRRNTKTGANSTNSSRRRGDVWEGTIVNIEHAGVSALGDNPLAVILHSLSHVFNRIDDHTSTNK